MLKNRLDIVWQDAMEILKNVDFSFLEGKTVLVTGATGLLGTHFLATLASLKEIGLNIKVIAACHSAPSEYTKEIARRGKISTVDDWPLNADVILHAAGYAQPAIFTNSPVETIRINTALTDRLLTRLNSKGKFLFVSSSEVYSGFGGLATESDIGTTNPSHPRACYIEGKRSGETIVNAYRTQGVDAKSIRLGLTYGPGTRQNDQRAMSGFIRQALEDKHVRMLYPGKEPRSFCYVRDAVETMWNVLLHGKEAVYNVGSQEVTSMAEVAFRISEIASVPITMPVDMQGELPGSGDVRMDVSRAEKEFGKTEYVNLKDGLARTIDWNRGFYV